MWYPFRLVKISSVACTALPTLLGPVFFLLMSDFVLVPVLLWPVLTLFLICLISSICFEIFKLILWFSARALIVSCRARRAQQDPTEFTTIINPSQERLIPNRQNIIIIYKLCLAWIPRNLKILRVVQTKSILFSEINVGKRRIRHRTTLKMNF